MFSGSTMGHHARRWLIAIGILELALAGAFAFGAFLVPIAGPGLLLTAVILGITGTVLVLVGRRVGQAAAKTDRILASGVAGTARITGLRQTGLYLNEQPQVEMQLSVQLPARAPYPATRKEFVPLILLARLTAGAPLPVRVDPADPGSIVIDWQAPAEMAPLPIASAGSPMAVGIAAAPGSGMDETLDQVQAALTASGMPAATPFSSPAQGGYTIEQLRAHLRQHGIAGTPGSTSWPTPARSSATSNCSRCR